MHAEFSHAHISYFLLSGHSLQFIVIFKIKTSILLSRVLGKTVALLFNGATVRFIVCILLLCRHFSVRAALKRHRPIDKKCIFYFLAPDFINSVISQYNGEHRTMNNHSKCA